MIRPSISRLQNGYQVCFQISTQKNIFFF